MAPFQSSMKLQIKGGISLRSLLMLSFSAMVPPFPGASAPPAPVIFLIGLSFVIQTIVVILTVFSGFNYIWKNRSLLGDIK